MTRRPRRFRLAGLSLAHRLMLNNLLVILAGAGTVLVIALLVAPAVFQYHLEVANITPDEEVLTHLARDFDQAILVALGMGILTAGIAAAAISWLAARRLSVHVEDAAQATGDLADGKLATRVVDPGIGPEFAQLASSLNELAARLESTEMTRRQLTADLAHQLRTPIASLLATIEAVGDGVLPLDEQALTTLFGQSHRLSRLVDDLEVVSRAGERQLLLSPEPVAVADLVEAAATANRERYRAAGVLLRTAISADAPAVRVDPDRIGEVLGNLLDNALRHSGRGGSVEVAVRLGGDRSVPAVAIEVSDDGSGFRPEDAERIFTRFDKAPGSPGSGLGLTIARAIIEAHHGSLTAHSAGPGTGAQFTITIPVSPTSAG